MNIFVLISLIIYSSITFSGEIYFQGPCNEKPFLRGNIEINNVDKSVGFYTVNLLNRSKIKFVGNANGISSIRGTPVGDNAIEVVSNSTLRAYGWCYEVNGIQPVIMPNNINITNNDIVRWFFAYSTYENGEWIDYCTPSYELKSKFLCNKNP